MLLSLLSLCVLGYKMNRSKGMPFDSVSTTGSGLVLLHLV